MQKSILQNPILLHDLKREQKQNSQQTRNRGDLPQLDKEHVRHINKSYIYMVRNETLSEIIL